MTVIGCLISLIIWVIVAVIILYVVEVLFNSFLPGPRPPIMLLLRILFGLLLLLALLDCLGVFSGGFTFQLWRPRG